MGNLFWISQIKLWKTRATVCQHINVAHQSHTSYYSCQMIHMIHLVTLCGFAVLFLALIGVLYQQHWVYLFGISIQWLVFSKQDVYKNSKEPLVFYLVTLHCMDTTEKMWVNWGKRLLKWKIHWMLFCNCDILRSVVAFKFNPNEMAYLLTLLLKQTNEK